MKNNTIGKIIIASIGVAIFGAVVEYDFPVMAENLYAIGGLGMMIFGVWGSIRLIKSNE